MFQNLLLMILHTIPTVIFIHCKYKHTLSQLFTGNTLYNHATFTRNLGLYGDEDSNPGLCVVTTCIIVVRYQCFGGPCCLHLQDEDGGSKVPRSSPPTSAAITYSWSLHLLPTIRFHCVVPT